MPSQERRWATPPESRRIAHPQKIQIKFHNSDRYIEEYLVDLSMTGMFVRCLNPPAPGTVFDFRMRLVTGGETVEGVASVVWVRIEQQRLSHPKGMGVRFLELSEAGRRQIRETVQLYAQDPGAPQELHTLRTVVEETLGELLGPEMGDGIPPRRETVRPEPRRAAVAARAPHPAASPRPASAAAAVRSYDPPSAASRGRASRWWLLVLVLLIVALAAGALLLRDRWLPLLGRFPDETSSAVATVHGPPPAHGALRFMLS